jgi:hypothetical protein
MRREQGKSCVLGAIAGGVGGFALWVVMIVVTTGVCSIPLLKTLRYTIPYAGSTTYSSITLWDMVLLVIFIGIGGSMGATRGSRKLPEVRW